MLLIIILPEEGALIQLLSLPNASNSLCLHPSCSGRGRLLHPEITTRHHSQTLKVAEVKQGHNSGSQEREGVHSHMAMRSPQHLTCNAEGHLCQAQRALWQQMYMCVCTHTYTHTSIPIFEGTIQSFLWENPNPENDKLSISNQAKYKYFDIFSFLIAISDFYKTEFLLVGTKKLSINLIFILFLGHLVHTM